MHEHGFWIPLTILFVLRPEQEETDRRLILRAAGTAAGLIVADRVRQQNGVGGDPGAAAGASFLVWSNPAKASRRS